ncbi:hypothetical protein I4I73_24250 [Pseudonocardia sp. KRD-184]|uniref:DUF8129 domain-containing protein n=1 Tax=Pseudonocardia oceani TaxID=2792013 RepID=A0ABS6UHX4_9PSEU|nr:hypothetical protein [Pseudonocardia oceani]MBW0092056.1 hypothetical protein [Pseudonocardia oceani]MBW0099110.1 hypothetical protein [Pseudonocardia oceani]MBW0112093.1 hypothetical protein [Pseudonocardia oceani]MBW0123072.1 hypothetical protein [Pseudonocardia oceani]MBW0131835.1 hypothetical protein [Pseudonocardia oceani]
MSERTDLPLPDYDHLTTGDLAGRVRTLPAAPLRELIAHEEAHGNRLPVLEVLRARLADVEDGAPLSAGDPAAARPEQAPAPDGGSEVSGAGAQVNNQPLRHGVAGQTPNRDIRGR